MATGNVSWPRWGRLDDRSRPESYRWSSYPEYQKERIRRDWYFGGEQFRNHLRDEADVRLGLNHLGSERDESGERKAERIVAEELERLGWGPTELGLRRKGDPDKVRIARRLRAETTRTLAWIAWRLKMGSWTNVSNLLRVPARKPGPPASRECQK